MPSKYELETKEIEFFIKMTSNILILFVLVLFVFSIARAAKDSDGTLNAVLAT